MDTIKKCKITRYDESIIGPPFLTIQIDSVEVYQPETDELGQKFAKILQIACKLKGYNFRFYTTGDSEYDYEIVIN